MSLSVREWLPWGVLSHETVRETLETAVAQWSEQWFTAPYAGVAAVRAAMSDARPDGDGTGWRVYGGEIAVRAGRSALSRMVHRALDLHTDLAGQTPADLRILAGLEEKILESLVETLERTLGVTGRAKPVADRPEDPLCDGGGLLVSLAEPSGREVLTLAVPSDVVFRHVKDALERPARRTARLQPLAEALADVHIALEARIGTVELTLSELSELAVGDVLVLDRRLDQAVDIAGLASHDVFAKAVLTHAEDGLALIFNA